MQTPALRSRYRVPLPNSRNLISGDLDVLQDRFFPALSAGMRVPGSARIGDGNRMIAFQIGGRRSRGRRKGLGPSGRRLARNESKASYIGVIRGQENQRDVEFGELCRQADASTGLYIWSAISQVANRNGTCASRIRSAWIGSMEGADPFALVRCLKHSGNAVVRRA